MVSEGSAGVEISKKGVVVQGVSSQDSIHAPSRGRIGNDDNYLKSSCSTSGSTNSSSSGRASPAVIAAPSTADSVVVETRRKNSRSTTGQVMLVIRPLLARTATSRVGREHQRFDGDCRLVAG